MTREEALTIINRIDRNILTDEECYVVDNIFELTEPSLPSDLDEAAEEYRDTEVCTDSDYIDDDGDSLYRSFALREAFKSGAKWMAEQGVSFDSKISKVADRAWVTPINEKQFERDVYDNFVSGDKVIVQIRKK